MVDKVEKMDLEIIRITGEGKGVAFTPAGRMVLISDVNENEKEVRVEITHEFEEVIYAKRIKGKRTDPNKALDRPGIVDSPYELDDEDNDDEGDDDE